MHQADLVNRLDDLSHIQVLLYPCDALLEEDHKFLLLAGALSTDAECVTEHLPLGVDEVLVALNMLKQGAVHVLGCQHVGLLQEHSVLDFLLFSTEGFAGH